MASAHHEGFRGNKKDLPHKTCLVCEKPMTYRKRWRNHWDQVLYCSDRCRHAKTKLKDPIQRDP